MPITSYQQRAMQRFNDVRARQMTVSSLATPFGCCNFFESCTDELMSLHYGGALPLLDWMGFNVSADCYKVLEFMAYVRPEFSGGNPTAGALSDACADPYGIEYGTAKISVEDFGRYGRTGPTREIMKPERYCATRPVLRLDGTPVTDEREWDIRAATDTLLQDIRRDIVVGNTTTAGEFDGLERWVRTGYAGPNGGMLDSYVVNWNGNPLAGGAGITLNGNAISATAGFIDVLRALVQRIMQRKKWAPMLMNQPVVLGDMILVMPTFIKECLLDYAACWALCDGGQYTPMNLQQTEVRNYRNELSAQSAQNLFGDGYIMIDGVVLPILAYDWELIKGPKTGDVYLLTGGFGGVRIWEGEHISASSAAAEYATEGYFTLDGGRILGKVDTENECREMKIWMHPRLFCKAPWAQIRFQSVQCDSIGGPLSPDPLETSFFPESSLSVAEC